MNYHKRSYLPQIVRSALEEDVGRQDITTQLTIPENKLTHAVLVAKENGVICGLDIVNVVFKTQDKKLKFKAKVLDGYSVKKGKVLAKISGRAHSILTAERVVLNFLTLLSGVATKTKKYVDAISPYKVRIMDTRKTIPGLRQLQKYAVRVGGGYNHRMRLDEMVLIKDNHKSQIQNLRNAIEQIKKNISKKIKIEVEVKNLREFKEVLKLKPDIIMLDNMNIKDIKRAVEIRNNSQLTPRNSLPKLEASGGITLKNVHQVASTGVEMISVGALTHSVDSLDISLEIL